MSIDFGKICHSTEEKPEWIRNKYKSIFQYPSHAAEFKVENVITTN